jgi:hypothetical protein
LQALVVGKLEGGGKIMEERIERIGLLTGGGDCPGLNAVIRSAVMTAINVYNWQVLGIEDGFEGLILPDLVRELTLTDVLGRSGLTDARVAPGRADCHRRRRLVEHRLRVL